MAPFTSLPTALIADVHGNLPALEAVLADIAARGITAIVNLGDHVSGPLWPQETAAFLMQQSWPTIAGNHDRMVAADDPASHGPSDRYAFAQLTPSQRAWLAGLPATLALEGGAVLLCHGVPADDRVYLLETPADGRLHLATPDQIARRLVGVQAHLVACGHSHVPRAVHHDGRLIVNPGSVGLPAYVHDGPHAHVSETGSPLARYAVVTGGHDEPRVEFVALAYDAPAAAARAEQNGRPDWAHALLTGFTRPV
jgi:predicted phosphodiesterase